MKDEQNARQFYDWKYKLIKQLMEGILYKKWKKAKEGTKSISVTKTIN